jgi:hypothetical protein
MEVRTLEDKILSKVHNIVKAEYCKSEAKLLKQTEQIQNLND